MWSRSLALALVALAGFGLSACGFQPLYGSGTTTASGARLSEAMSAVNVAPIPGRVGQKVRNELIFASTGGNYAPEPRYSLKIVLTQGEVEQLVQITGDARGTVLVLTASFTLTDIASGNVIYQGSTLSRAAFNRYQEIFANRRARYDAENRAAGEVAKSVKTQIAASLARSG